MIDTLFPSDRKILLIEVFHLAGDPPFVCGVNGRLTYEGLGEIEDDLEEMTFHQGDGTYLFEAQWAEAQTGEYGRIELPAYWDLTPVRFAPLKLPDEVSNP